ncbi:SagB/ThcOx family dehydrogenase [Nocardia gipuzkoensis]
MSLKGKDFRRAHGLIAWFDGDELVLENYLTGQQTVVHPHVLSLLGRLGEPCNEQDTVALLGGEGSRTVFDQLVERGVLLACGSTVEVRDADVAARWEWGHAARYFHYSTARTHFCFDLAQVRADLVRRAQQQPPPPPFKDYGNDDVVLDADQPAQADLWDTLGRRRTGRAFSDEPISSDDLATVLRWTWSITRLRTDPQIGAVTLKTSPSGGARHPVEVYPIVSGVEGVRPGVYHYCAGRNSMHRLRTGHFAQDILEVCSFQPWVADVPVVFLMTGTLDRIAWKYRQSHAYRVLLMDAGHLGQSFHLVCTALGLSPWTSAALDEAAAHRLLGIDGTGEIVLYAAACGHPARHTDSGEQPPSVHPASTAGHDPDNRHPQGQS